MEDEDIYIPLLPSYHQWCRTMAILKKVVIDAINRHITLCFLTIYKDHGASAYARIATTPHQEDDAALFHMMMSEGK
jgi:hypothetical protein